MPCDPTEIIGEILGKPTTSGVDLSDSDYTCPFIHSRCIKRSTSLPGEAYPVCSIWVGKKEDRQLVCVCPKRFYQVDFLPDVVARCWPGTPPRHATVAPEVKMTGFGNVDFVIADVPKADHVEQFLSVELQAIDITGSVMPAYLALRGGTLLVKKPTYGLNWDNVYKRYITQLIRKGFFHHHWHTKIVAVLQDAVYKNVVRRAAFMRSTDVHDDTVNIIFLTYRYKEDASTPGEMQFVVDQVEGTSHSNLQNAVLYKSAPDRDAFCKRIIRSIERAAR